MGRKPDLTNLTPEKRKELFLARLRKEPNITVAARAAGWARGYVYELRDDDPEFAAAWQEALDESVDLAESEVHRRAFKGSLKPVYQGGVRVGSIREYSDTLAIFLLKAHRPEKYRENLRHEHSGPGGGPIETAATVTVYLPDNGRGDGPGSGDDDSDAD